MALTDTQNRYQQKMLYQILEKNNLKYQPEISQNRLYREKTA